MRIKTYIISLKESVERKMHMTQEACRFPFMDIEWVDAVCGKHLSEENLDRLFNIEKFMARYSRPPAKGEIGCTLSHRKCYKHLLTCREPYALILEDDISFIYPEDTEYILAQGIRLLEEGEADIVVFLSKVLYYNRSKKINLKYAVYPVRNAFGTYSYLINRHAGKCLLKNNREDTVADDWQAIRRYGLKIKSIYPSITNEVSNSFLIQSTIEDGRKQARSMQLRRTFGRRLKIYSEIIYCRLSIKCGWMIDRNFYNPTKNK